MPVSEDEGNIRHLNTCTDNWCKQCEALLVVYSDCDYCGDLYHDDTKELKRNSTGWVLCKKCYVH